jgi:hypothetical protein
MRIAYNGNVGIGTNNPSVKLHVIGDVTFSGTNTANSFVGPASGLTNAPVWNTTGGGVIARGTNYNGSNGIFYSVGTTNYIQTFP